MRSAVARTVQPGRILMFVVVFLGLVIVFLVALEADRLWSAVREPYCSWLARAGGTVVGWTGADTEVHGTRLRADRFHVRIVRHCDGLAAMAILAAAILAFPSRLAAKAVGLSVGLVAVFVANILRIVVLVLLGVHSPRIFTLVHVYVFQTFIIAFTVVCFLVWVHAVSREHLPRPASGPALRP